MTLTEFLEIGDRVVFKVNEETRAWTDTYKDVPDGTEGIICGFHDAIDFVPRWNGFGRKPGVYHYRGATTIMLDDGRTVPGGCAVNLKDKELEQRRSAERRSKDGVLLDTKTYLTALPETRFWELDRVMVTPPESWNKKPYEATISRIDYREMHNKRKDGSPWPFYVVELPGGGTMNVEEAWCELVERGNLWKQYHNEPTTFEDDTAALAFAAGTGAITEVRNPNTGNFNWELEEALEALRQGDLHYLKMSGIFNVSRLGGYLCHDAELGRRIAKMTLDNFSAEAVTS